jgi:hypothetical protein
MRTVSPTPVFADDAHKLAGILDPRPEAEDDVAHFDAGIGRAFGHVGHQRAARLRSRPSPSAMSSFTSWMRTPSQPRRVSPNSRS